MRSRNGEYSEYHTSADNLDFVRPEALADSLEIYLSVLSVLENDDVLVNLNPKGEPQLGRRGLYPSVGAQRAEQKVMARLWVLNLSDGNATLLDIAERAELPFSVINEAAAALVQSGLLKPLPSASFGGSR
jgi:aminopeptidase-like protein